MIHETIALIIFFLVTGGVAWSIFSTIRRYKIAKLLAGIQSKLLDKFGTSQDLLVYVQSDAGKQLLTSLAVENAPEPAKPHGRIIAAVQAGVVLIALSAALLFLRKAFAHAPHTTEGFLIFGALTLALGIGFVLAGAASYGLSRSFGLLKETSNKQ